MTRNVAVVGAVVMLLSGSAWGQSKANASRVDFDDQLVQGQVNKGAVHLIERKDSDLGSLVKKRTSYRKEILAGTAVSEAKPARTVAVLPAALPIVKVAELKGEIVEPAPAPVPAAKTVAPAPAPAPAKAAVKPAAKKNIPAKKPAAKQSKSNANGGSRVLSRR